jgi:acetolactate synthase-1/2/3 large subunit
MYGVPGEENDDVMISLLDSPIDFITTRHEQTAAFMAAMHGQLTGIPGVCIATLGPGATNLLTGVAQANMDNAPLVAIIGQADTTRLHKISHQNMSSVDMYKPVTKWVTTIPSADVIPEVVSKAFKIARSGIPGAVLIELPEDIAKHDTDAKVLKPFNVERTIGTTPEAIDVMLDLLAKSKKPLLLIGDGCVRSESDDQLKTFLDKTDMYAAYTFMGKGAINNLYDRSLHCVGLGMKDVALKAFDESDLIICVGYDTVEWPPSRWNPNGDKTVIHINRQEAEVDQGYMPSLEMVGNIPVILNQINKQLTGAQRKPEPYFEAIQKKAEADIRSFKDDDRFPMTPKRILRDVRDVLGDDDILVSDVGAHKMWIARQYGAKKSKTCFISNGFCSMGGSMPGALEAKRLNPNKNVLAICGDGGFMMSIQALVTGVRYNIPFVTLVWDDNAYGLIKWKQEMAFRKESNVELDNPDLVALSKAFGCHSRAVESSETLVDDLKWAFAHQDKPTVLVVPVDYSENMKLFHHLKEVVE